MQSHTKFSDHQASWHEKKRLRNLVGVVSKKRLDSLVTARDGYGLGGSPSKTSTKRFNFRGRNMSMSPSVSRDPIRYEMAQSAVLQEEGGQHRTYA